MHIRGCSFIVALLLTLPVQAQPTPPETLDTVLRGWEKTMTELSSFACRIERQSLDKALDANDEFKGYALFAKANKKENGNRALLQLEKVGNAKVFEKYICTGAELYEYAPANKVVRVYPLPNAKQVGLPQENLLAFLFGMGAEHAKTRYHMELEKPEPSSKAYYSIRFTPKADTDKSDFTAARLLIYRSNSMPAQIWYVQPNKNETTWTLSDVRINPALEAKLFQPELAGWKVNRVTLPSGLPPKK